MSIDAVRWLIHSAPRFRDGDTNPLNYYFRFCFRGDDALVYCGSVRDCVKVRSCYRKEYRIVNI